LKAKKFKKVAREEKERVGERKKEIKKKEYNPLLLFFFFFL